MTLYMAISGGVDWKDCVQPLQKVSEALEYMCPGERKSPGGLGEWGVGGGGCASSALCVCVCAGVRVEVP